MERHKHSINMLDDTESKNDSAISDEQREIQRQQMDSATQESPPPKATAEIKKTVVTEEYKLTEQVLGLGINGNVWAILQKKSGQKYALKVFISPWFQIKNELH